MYTQYFTITLHSNHPAAKSKPAPLSLAKMRLRCLIAGAAAVIASLIITAVANAPVEAADVPAPAVYFRTSISDTYKAEPLPLRYNELYYGDFVADETDDAEETAVYEEYDVPAAESGRKLYMDYRAITDHSSKQWELQEDAWTDENGFRRYGDFYMVAMGTYYSPVCGEKFHITLESGAEIDVIIGDVKADRDTDALNQHTNGNVIEFIVDTSAISKLCKYHGDMSYADDMFAGKITSIRSYEPISE